MRAQSILDVLIGKNNKEAFDSEKALAALTLILTKLGGKGDKHQLVKMMYWLERRYIIETGFPMFFDQVFSLHYGPIVSQTLDNINFCKLETAPWYGYIYIADSRNITLIKTGDLDLLSLYDEELISDTVERFKDMDFNDRKDFFHSLPEYTQVPVGQREPISYRSLLLEGAKLPVVDLDEALLEIESVKLER